MGLDEVLRSARAFIFDFYGTLAGDEVSIPAMWRVLADLGYPSHPELEAMFEPDGFDGTTTASVDQGLGHGKWIEENWRRFVQISGVSAERVEDVLTRLIEVRATYRSRALPGALEIMSLLRARNVRIGLCSNWENDIIPYLSQAGLPPFDALATSIDVGARKPHRLIFATICTRLDVDPRDAVFVGDNWAADIVGALRYGMTPVWIRHDRASRGLSTHVAEFGSLADFVGHLDRLFRSG